MHHVGFTILIYITKHGQQNIKFHEKELIKVCKGKMIRAFLLFSQQNKNVRYLCKLEHYVAGPSGRAV
jgi:hypothetical protein